jgi:heme-degrading monooxygenase HmoA
VTFRPEPPYYAVIISTWSSGEDPEGYAAMNRRMAELGSGQPGYLGRDSSTAPDGHDVTVLYYTDAASITTWKAHPEHLEAQSLGKSTWYTAYRVEITRVERTYYFTR